MTLGPRSAQFDDIYFSPEDGLAETRHVFLENNNLPGAWAGRARFTIGETGFGTGLNFLAAWTLFEETATPSAILDYVSFEKYPLSAAEIAQALLCWSGAFGGRLERLVRHYPLRIPGWHRVDFGRVRLTLIFDDVNEALPRVVCPGGIDCWFLDGFAPAKNPQMWTQHVFDHMARLSRGGASVATFTAAGLVKRGLAQAGFSVQKKSGYGRKRDMVTAHFMGGGATAPAQESPRNIAIIGAGLAGTACAHVLALRGYAPVVFDTAGGIASGASGNPYGIFNPRLSATRSVEADFYMSAYAQIVRSIPPCEISGTLHLINDDDKLKRFSSCQKAWGWQEEQMRLVDALEASDLAGVPLSHSALYLGDSAQVSPYDLCHHWVKECEIRLSTHINAHDIDSFDAVILANGMGAKDFIPWLPVHTVRGQIIVAGASEISQNLKKNLCYGGYIGAAHNQSHVIGSTFQKWLSSTDPCEEDTRDIIANLQRFVPGMDINLSGVASARASLRCSAQDRFPVIGAVPGCGEGVYVSTGHGSHGVVSSLAGAHLIADMIDKSVCSLPIESVTLLSPQRFLDRAIKRGQNEEL